MTKFVMVAAFVATFAVPAMAGTYADAMRTCGAEWRASDARKAVTKGGGRVAWNTYRAECTKRVGWERKASK